VSGKQDIIDHANGALAHSSVPTGSDYPTPEALLKKKVFVWDDGNSPVDNYRALGKRLACSGDLYRRSAYASGLLLASEFPDIEPLVIGTAKKLSSIILDRLRIEVRHDGEIKRNTIPSAHLGTMLASEAFLQQFRPIDRVVKTSCYSGEFALLKRGYNDGGPGERVLSVGPDAETANSLDTITAFLDVMAFESTADRTNAVAAALTVQLRNFWPGAKPLIAVTATKSHAGKDTIILFACGSTPQVSVSYQSTDWPLERSIVGALKHCPNTGVIVIDNARPDRGSKQIKSAFLERLITDSNPFLFSTGTGEPMRRKNDLVVAISSNEGTISEDLMNRALPIRLNPVGNVADRRSPIGNPKLEYLPANCMRIDAEYRGIVQRWVAAGKPLDLSVKHNCTQWAQQIGGMLQVSGFRDFLGNSSLRRTADDPLRRGLGLLGAARLEEWQSASLWAQLAVDIGVLKAVISEADRGTEPGRCRGIGIVLTGHRGETFEVETEDEKLTLILRKARRRFDPKTEPSTRYRFDVLDRQKLPEDPEATEET